MKKTKKIIFLIIIITLISSVTFVIGKQIGLNTDTSSISTTIEEKTVGTQTIKKTLTSSGEIQTANTEKLTPSTTKYFETMCVEDDDIVKEGENILKYTDGTYLTAPYDCVIKTINIPEAGGKCTNEHYIEVESTGLLAVQFKVDETSISKISLGQEAEIEISAFDDKVLSGTVTNISNTASNGKFTVTVQFENDGEVKLGMSAEVSI